MIHVISFLLTFNQATNQTYYLIKNLKPSYIFLANAPIPHERVSRLRQIGPTGLRSALSVRIRTPER